MPRKGKTGKRKEVILDSRAEKIFKSDVLSATCVVRGSKPCPHSEETSEGEAIGTNTVSDAIKTGKDKSHRRDDIEKAWLRWAGPEQEDLVGQRLSTLILITFGVK